jgi:2-C-methyl-D-erythritol 2,4-cyclodiphosphate synthase
MRECVAKALGVDISSISVKATTEEKLGFTGQGAGIASAAVVLLERK